MACLLVLVIAATVLTGPPGKLTHAARTSPAEAFWHAALPGAPMPEAIRELLRPAGAAGTNAPDAARSRHHDADPPPMNFKYEDYRSSRRNEATATSAEALDRAGGAGNAAASPAVFFLEEAVRVGGVLPFRGMVPRGTASVAVASPPMRLYKVRAVRAIDGRRFMVCRRDREDGPDGDAVYGCRATGPARAYAVGVVGERGETVAATVVCRTDTSRWNRVRAAFRLLDVKPGGAAVCHAALGAQVIPVKNDSGSSLV
ncbi:BURP domain-containing protein 15 precursor [Zea mays]|uniref:BURP domain containing protein n=3 Tax=Zea mays TaxID=4577 RepID=A0A096R6F6_MAIZE|nr:BURP domain-containing protein 15 precursor [Zea mays]AMR36682.1 BURP9 [Zea mays]ONM55747.1 BURP domain containing protein [Zea mays]|eukprot:NP_001150610.2 uncharacterized protein LOC100284243 precursor [Zea mays]